MPVIRQGQHTQWLLLEKEKNGIDEFQIFREVIELPPVSRDFY